MKWAFGHWFLDWKKSKLSLFILTTQRMKLGWRKLNKSKLLGKYSYWANSCYVYADVPANNAGVPK
jgi:hypothetical protein